MQKRYTSIWESQLNRIIEFVSLNESISYSIDCHLFKNAGNRNNYNFSTIDFQEGKSLKYPSNNAVARDLIDVLEKSTAFQKACKNKLVSIRLKEFKLIISVNKYTLPTICTKKFLPNNLKIGLEPWVGENPKVLILGILPGDESIRLNSYYQNPKNSFWKIMDALFDDYNDCDRKNFIFSHHIALWDCMKQAHRQGCMDSGFEDEGEPNDLNDFLNRYPSIECIVLNGKGKTTRFFDKHFYSLRNSYSVIDLNSTASYVSLNAKIKEWSVIKSIVEN